MNCFSLGASAIFFLLAFPELMVFELFRLFIVFIVFFVLTVLIVLLVLV